MTTTPTVLFVPGLRDHVDDHWPTHAQKKIHGSHCVAPLEHDKLSRDARVEALQAALAAIDGPVVLAAHSAGCMIVVQWAQKYRRDGIVGALLAAPADVEAPMPAGYPTVDQLAAAGWTPIPRQPLAFPSLVAASTNDPLCSFARAGELARAWGSRFLDVGAVGHINPPAGFGPWKQGEDLIRDML